MCEFVLTSSYERSIENDERPRKKLRPSASLDTVALLNDSGISAFQEGNFEEAEKSFSQALCRFDVRFLDSSTNESTDTPSKSQTFLYIYQRHEYDEGMEVYITPLVLKETSTHESVSSILFYNIALTQVRRGQYETARTWLNKAFSRIQSFEASSSGRLIQILHNLGYCCYRLGKNADAIQHFEQALTLAIQIRADDTAVAACLNCLGVLHFHRHADDGADKTMDLLKQSLAVYRKRLGSLMTKEVATVLNNIGRVYYLWSEYEQALEIYGEALKIRTLLLGKNSIDVAATMYNTGQTHHQMSQFDEAMEYYDGFLELAKARLGTESRDVAIVYRCIAEIHHERGDLKKALVVFQNALQSGRASLGNLHPEVASTLNKLGNLCYEMQDHQSALKHYKEGLEVEQGVLAPDHPHMIITLTNIAHIYKHRSDYAGAKKAYRQVHAMQEKTFGVNSIEVAVTLSNIGLMQYHLKSFDGAFESYQEALRVRRDHYGSDEHPDVASTLNSIGLVLFKQDMFDLSKHCFTESLRIRKKILGPDHRDVAILWYNIATIYFETGQDEVAIRLYKETLRVERAALGADHPDVGLTLQHIGQVLQQLGDLDGALKYFLEALEMERRRGHDQLLVAKILNLIGNIYLQQGKVTDMMHCFIEASRIYDASDGCHQPRETLVIAGYNFYGLSKIHPACAAVA